MQIKITRPKNKLRLGKVISLNKSTLKIKTAKTLKGGNKIQDYRAEDCVLIHRPPLEQKFTENKSTLGFLIQTDSQYLVIPPKQHCNQHHQTQYP